MDSSQEKCEVVSETIQETYENSDDSTNESDSDVKVLTAEELKHLWEEQRKASANQNVEAIDLNPAETVPMVATIGMRVRPGEEVRSILRHVSKSLSEFLSRSLGTPTVRAATNAPRHFLTLSELEKQCQDAPPNFVVDGLLPEDDVSVVVGDSGLGKTPWAYQLGLCVAAGKPFHGHAVKQGPVLYYDMENGRQQVLSLARGLCQHLQIGEFPSDFRVYLNDSERPSVGASIANCAARLVIIDSLRAFEPDAEGENSEMAQLLRVLRGHALENRCAILLLHHIRKSNEFDRAASLEEVSVIEWLQRASGARSLINQTNTRIALAAPDKADAALVMKSCVKLQGESGPVYLQRVCDEAGTPIGYSRVCGVELIGNPEDRAAFANLPNEFRFKDAARIFDRTDDPTNKRLQKYIGLGILEKASRGEYRKLDPHPQNQ